LPRYNNQFNADSELYLVYWRVESRISDVTYHTGGATAQIDIVIKLKSKSFLEITCLSLYVVKISAAPAKVA